jgi:hypothetical protein
MESAFTDIGFNNRLWLVRERRAAILLSADDPESKRLARLKLSAVSTTPETPRYADADAALDLYTIGI